MSPLKIYLVLILLNVNVFAGKIDIPAFSNSESQNVNIIFNSLDFQGKALSELGTEPNSFNVKTSALVNLKQHLKTLSQEEKIEVIIFLEKYSSQIQKKQLILEQVIKNQNTKHHDPDRFITTSIQLLGLSISAAILTKILSKKWGLVVPATSGFFASNLFLQYLDYDEDKFKFEIDKFSDNEKLNLYFVLEKSLLTLQSQIDELEAAL